MQNCCIESANVVKVKTTLSSPGIRWQTEGVHKWDLIANYRLTEQATGVFSVLEAASPQRSYFLEV